MIDKASSPLEVIVCSYSDIKFIPETFDTEHAMFASRKKPEIWFKGVINGDIVGCGCLVIMSKVKVRVSNDFIIPKYRGRGFIKKILNAREYWAKINGYKEADVISVKKYYPANGYKSVQKYSNGQTRYKKTL